MRKRNALRYVFAVLLLIVAVGLFAYPVIANYVFEHRADSIVQTVEASDVDETDPAVQEQIQQAQAYNEVIAGGHVQLTDPFMEEQLDEEAGEYYDLLNMTDDGVMGVIEIPAIDVSLPIYHGTSEAILEKGVGHLQGTSLPIGGESTHTVLTGHSGLSNAKLFTDLTAMEEGDYFFLHVFGEKLAYQVDQKTTVLPAEISNLQVEPGQDYCTLVTCTPYGVNSHRLLVRGHRTDYEEAAADPSNLTTKAVDSEWMSEYRKALGISLGLCVSVLAVVFLIRYMGSRSRIVDEFM